jgi:hypothetical protein
VSFLCLSKYKSYNSTSTYFILIDSYVVSWSLLKFILKYVIMVRYGGDDIHNYGAKPKHFDAENLQKAIVALNAHKTELYNVEP